MPIGSVVGSGSGSQEVARLTATVRPKLSRDFGRDLSSQLNQVAGGIERAGRALTAAITVPIVGAGIAGTKMAFDFQKSLTAIRTQVGLSKDAVESFGRTILREGPKWGKSPQELADGLFFVASAGYEGAEALDILQKSARASAIGMGEVTLVADILTSAIAAYGRESLDAAKASDVLLATVNVGKAEADSLASAFAANIPIAAALGVELEEIGGSLAIMTRRGVDAQEAATQLNSIFAAFVKPSNEANEALQKIGLSAEEVRKRLGQQGLLPTLLELNKHLGGNFEALGMILGRQEAIRGFFTIVNGDASETTQVFDAVRNSTGELDKAFAIWAETSEGKVARAIGEIRGTLIELGEIVLPVVADMLEKATEKLRKWVDAWRDMDEEKQRRVIDALLALAAAGPGLIATGVAIRGIVASITLITGLTTPLGLVLLVIGAIALALAGLGLAAIAAYRNSEEFRAGVDAFVKTVRKGWEEDIKPALESLWRTVEEDLIPALTSLLKSFGIESWEEFGTTIGKDLVGKVTAFIDIVKFVISWFSNWVEAIATVINIFRALIGVVGLVAGRAGEILGGLVSFITDSVVSPIVNLITKTLPDAFTRGVDLIASFWDSLRGKLARPINAVIGFVNNPLISGFNSLAKTLKLNIQLPSLGLIPGFAFGGVFPGYTPGRDVGMIAVSGGEAVMRPEWTRVVGEDYIEGANAAARRGGIEGVRRFAGLAGVRGMEGFADGGIVGSALNFLTSPMDRVFRLLGSISDPKKALQDKLLGELGGRLGSGGFADFPIAMAKLLIEGAVGSLFKGVGILRGIVGSGGNALGGWAGMQRWIQSIVPGSRVSSGYRPGSQVNGNFDYHHFGRAIDIVPSPGPIANMVVDAIRAFYHNQTRELIHTPAGSRQIWNGRDYVFQGAELQNSHFDHVHWAMRQGGIVPMRLFDQGGMWRPGEMGLNMSGSNEMVWSADTVRDLVSGTTMVKVYVGDRELTDIIDVQIEHHTDELVEQLNAN